MIVGAYVLPLMHQSSLGGLMLLAGDKVHPFGRRHFCRSSTCWQPVCAAWGL